MLHFKKQAFQTITSAFQEGVRFYTWVTGPYRRFRNSIAFALLVLVVRDGGPMRQWAVKPSYWGVIFANYSQWLIKGFTWYVLLFHSIHMPVWLTVLTVLTSLLFPVALAAGEMEMKDRNYLAS